jgi:hypothetical protein
MAIVNPTAINPYNGVFGALLVAKEAVQQTGEALTKADAIPVFAQTMAMDLGFAMEQPALEDPYGTSYLGQVTSAKCTWSFEAPLYGLGTSAGTGPGLYNILVPRFVTEVLQTAFTVTATNNVANPTLDLTPTANSDGVNDSFSMQGFFAIKGSPGGGASPPNAMLSAYLVGCRISKATVSIKSDGLHRIKLEGLGIYQSDWSDTDIDLSGANWDAVAQEFIRGMGQAVRLQVNAAGDEYVANATMTEVSVDFGAEAIMSDGALTTLGVGAIGLTKRDVAISIDPIWVEASVWSIFSVARAGGYFNVTSAFAYPSAYSSGTAAKGRGFKFTLPKVQFANTTPNRATATRMKLDGVSVKNSENDEPLTLTLGSE